MVTHIYVIEIDFNNDTEVDHNGVAISISAVVKHLKRTGVLASFCNPPSQVEILSVTALASADWASIQLQLFANETKPLGSS